MGSMLRSTPTSVASTKLAFWICGLVNNVVFVVYLSAAEDLLETKAGVILLLSVLPGLVTKAVLPCFAHNLSYFFRIALTSVILCLCCIGVALSSSTSTRLTFLGVSSCAGSLGEVTFLALTSKHDPSTVGAWSSGTGFAGVSGAGVYYVIRSRLGLSSKQALLFVSPMPLLMLASYMFFLGTPETLRDNEVLADTENGDPPSIEKGYEVVNIRPTHYPSLRRRTYITFLLSRYMIPLMSVYFLEYVINQGIAPTLDRFWFKDSAMLKATSAEERSRLYTSYQLSYQMGVFISRSSIERVKIPQIWIFPPLQLGNLALLLVGALYTLVPSQLFVMGVMFFEGLVGGGIYVNAFYKLRRTMPDDLKAWALGAAGVGDAAGVTLAAVVNIWLECGIRLYRGEPACHSLTSAPRQGLRGTNITRPR
jgi:battenin